MTCKKTPYRSVRAARLDHQRAGWRIKTYWCRECGALHSSNRDKAGRRQRLRPRRRSREEDREEEDTREAIDTQGPESLWAHHQALREAPEGDHQEDRSQEHKEEEI